MKNCILFIFFLFKLFSSAICQENKYETMISQWQDSPAEIMDNKEKLYGLQSPTFSGKTFSGDSLYLSEHEGKVIFLYHTSIHCGPCVANTENMNKLAHQYASKVKFIALTGDTRREIEMYKKKKPYLDFDIIPRMSYVWNRTFKMPSAYPIIMLLNREHKIKYIKLGANPDAEQYWEFIEDEVVPVIEACL